MIGENLKNHSRWVKAFIQTMRDASQRDHFQEFRKASIIAEVLMFKFYPPVPGNFVGKSYGIKLLTLPILDIH
jgi:hypothetical protein